MIGFSRTFWAGLTRLTLTAPSVCGLEVQLQQLLGLSLLLTAVQHPLQRLLKVLCLLLLEAQRQGQLSGRSVN